MAGGLVIWCCSEGLGLEGDGVAAPVAPPANHQAAKHDICSTLLHISCCDHADPYFFLLLLLPGPSMPTEPAPHVLTSHCCLPCPLCLCQCQFFACLQNRLACGGTLLPQRYRRLVIKAQSSLRYEEFDFSYYNRTRFAGLENDLPNCYCNALLQVSGFAWTGFMCFVVGSWLAVGGICVRMAAQLLLQRAPAGACNTKIVMHVGLLLI
jgi:hypothetical protein